MAQYVVIGNGVAAGDCTEGEDISFHGKRVLAILPNTYIQGNCAGINMVGGSSVFDKAIPMNSIGFFGLHAMTAGIYTSLIRERIPLNSIDFNRLKKTATSTAFSVEKRKQFFGGVV